MKHEAPKPKIRELHFKPEGYTSSSDIEFLEEFLGFIKDKGFNPDKVVFSGFDGTPLVKGEPLPQHPSIYMMNEAAWRNSIKMGISNPAEYADGWEVPCVGLYEREQLAHVYSSKMHLDDPIEDRIELSDVVLGDLLADQPPEIPIEEAVVHKNYPEGSPTDALIGIVFLED